MSTNDKYQGIVSDENGNPDAPKQRLVDTPRAAEYLGLAKNTLDKMRIYGRRQDNSPRFVKLGRSVRYDLRELDAYIARNTTISTSEYDPPRS
jgi:predicted DNA-binding transcriptional regulator AlpA